MLDLDFSKIKYTWSNNITGGSFTKEKSNRALASYDWISIFADGDVQVLYFVSSDHLPLLLTIESNYDFQSTTKRFLQYEIEWSIFDECFSIIFDIWHSSVYSVGTSTSIVSKLYDCMLSLKKWSKTKCFTSYHLLQSKIPQFQALQ